MVLERREEPNNGAAVNFLSPKSKKMKKVPQRGLGVAQLERLRIEEQQQQKNNPTTPPASSSVPPVSDMTRPFPLPPPPEPKQPSLHQSPSVADLADLFQPRLSFDSAGSTITTDASNPVEHFSTPRLVSQPGRSNQQYFPNIALAKSTVVPSWLSSPGVVHRHHQMELPSKQVVDLQMEPPSNQIYRNYIQTFSSLTEEERVCIKLKRPMKFSSFPPNQIYRNCIKTFSSLPEKERMTKTSSTCAMPAFDSLSLTNFTLANPYLLKPDETMLFMRANDPTNFESSFRERASSSGATHQVDLRNNSDMYMNNIYMNYKGAASSGTHLSSSSLAQSSSRTIQRHRELTDCMPSPEYSNCTEDSQQPFFNFLLPRPPPTSREPANNGSGEAFEDVDTTLKL